jgi:hypothetical protein
MDIILVDHFPDVIQGKYLNRYISGNFIRRQIASIDSDLHMVLV